MKIAEKYVFYAALCALSLFVGAFVCVGLLSNRNMPPDSIIAVSAPDVKKGEGANRKICVILDPGHGGMDSGAVGIDGTLEKDRNLTIAFLVEKDLKANGIDVVLTRSDDRLLTLPDSGLSVKMQDLKARTMTTLGYENCVFVSLHMNKFPIEKYSGLQIWYGAKNADSLSLANAVKTSVTKTLQPENHRENKKAGSNIYVLSHTEVPAILVECGFLSNAEECRKLGDPKYQYDLAKAISEGIADYVKQTEDKGK